MPNGRRRTGNEIRVSKILQVKLHIAWTRLRYFTTVTAAGSTEVNGIYEANGTAGGRQSFAAASCTGGAREGMMMCFNPDKNRWEILDPVMLETLYTAASETLSPPSAGWKVEEGDAPCPQLTLKKANN